VDLLYYLNLPEQVQFGANDNLRYTYDAAGNKLAKVVDGTVAGNNTRLDYSGNFLYENNELKAIFTSAGRIIPFDNGGETIFKFEYNLQDHLGNTRVVFSGHSNGQPEVMQVTDYYPFGMVMNQQNYFASGVLSNKYLYNNKELQDDELAGNSLGWYDYGARFYDPQLGRFHTLDNLSEKYYFQSPYTYAANNPILFIDWMGMEPKIRGPYSGRAYIRNDGTVVVYRVTTGQRVMANTTKQAIFSAGWLGTGLSIYDAVRGFNAKEIGGSLRGGFFQFGEDLSKTAADDAVVGINQGLFAKSALGFRIFGKSLSVYQIGKAMADDTPTQSEALHSATFNFGKRFQGGKINIANPSLMEFTRGENSESVENHMNAIFNTLEQNLSGFDLTTNKGVKEANKYLNENLNQIIKQINQMLKDDEEE
jgi:RHS repeat-associated protein